MSYNILDTINSPDDVKGLDSKQIKPLCDEVRSFLIDKVSVTGGHLASNLGVVELSVALHRVFNSPEDHIIFDVGHQSYVHKMLTGRKDCFGGCGCRVAQGFRLETLPRPRAVGCLLRVPS